MKNGTSYIFLLENSYLKDCIHCDVITFCGVLANVDAINEVMIMPISTIGIQNRQYKVLETEFFPREQGKAWALK